MGKDNEDISRAAVGVFDSGVGGLTVAREIMRQIPGEQIIYFGDTARVPYGTKSKETVLRYSRQIISFLMSRRVKAIVVACNTASAYALEEIEKDLEIPMIGVLKPGARVAAAATENGRVGVIGTAGTIKSGRYKDFIREQNPDVEVLGKACPLLVSLVEEGMLHDPVTDEMVSRYLAELKQSGIDTLIMGCTHYPLIRSTIRRIIGDQVTLVNPAYETAVGLKELLDNNGLSNRTGEVPEHEYYVSDSVDKFKEFADSVLPLPVTRAEKINIEEFGVRRGL